MYNSYSMDLAGRPLVVEIGRVAELAGGACIVRYGDTVVLVTATASDSPKEGVDFFPLSVSYEEKMYSVGKIPGGFIKREGRPSESAILASRLIDRSIRPLFPSDYRNDVGVVATILSVDQDCSPEMASMIGTSIALSISNIPWAGPISAVNMGFVNDELICNPTEKQREDNQMIVTVSSNKEKVVMLEAGANEVPEDIVYDAILKGHEINKKVIDFISDIAKKEGKEKQVYEEKVVPNEIFEGIKSFIGYDKMEEAVFTDDKTVRDENMKKLKEEVRNYFMEIDEGYLEYIDDSIYKFEKETVRKMILKDHKRPDGRRIDQIRKLESDVDILPRTHGTGMFKRGQTQVLTITTLGSMADIQKLDGLDLMEDSKRYMHHYNFPSFSVGETRPSRGPGRREIGHGALAEKALLPVIPSEEEFPYAMRLVSEVLSSNGSTSQASVCASTLSLMAAGVPIKAPVAGISVGLVTDKESDEFITLTDIQGLEDFFGDMDFKVAGTKKGITAIQLDMKVHGISDEVIEKALYQAREARFYILDEVMLKAIDKPRDEISEYAPMIETIKIDPEKISEVIGTRGKVINKIIEETGVKIDIEDDGNVFVCGLENDKVKRAIEIIKSIVFVPEPGQVFKGKVARIMNFGAFVEFANNKEGMVHISKISKERVGKVEDVLKIGQEVEVKVIKIDEKGRIDLTMVLDDKKEDKKSKKK